MLISIPMKVYIILYIVIVWNEILYILSYPYGNPSFKGVPDNIQPDYEPIESLQN